MYSWSGIGVPTTKAIIRESARLVNLTLGRAGFFMLRRLLRGGRPLEQVGRLPRSAHHAIQKSRDGVVFAIAKSPPLTALDFWIFWAIPSTPTEQETFVSRPVGLRQYTPKTAFFSVPNPLI